MLRIIKHIILFGDSTRHLSALQQRIREIDPEAASYIADICSIGEVLGRQQADMILIYTGDTACFPYVQRIRREPLADRIPVFVCREPLEEEVLKALLNGSNRF